MESLTWFLRVDQTEYFARSPVGALDTRCGTSADRLVGQNHQMLGMHSLLRHDLKRGLGSLAHKRPDPLTVLIRLDQILEQRSQ